jgi:hypothetical protein
MYRLSRNSGASTSWNPKGPSRTVAENLYLMSVDQKVMYFKVYSKSLLKKTVATKYLLVLKPFWIENLSSTCLVVLTSVQLSVVSLFIAVRFKNDLTLRIIPAVA